MNRNDEFKALTRALEEEAPSLNASLRKAERRRARKRYMIRPLIGLAAVFAVFVALVNLSTPVASALSRIPVLTDLVRAVRFSPSLEAAVQNDYVQLDGQSQTKNGVTVTVEYLIVDDQQLHVFYRLETEEPDRISTIPSVILEPDVSYYGVSNLSQESEGDLMHAFVFLAQTPEYLTFRLQVMDRDDPDLELARFDFPLRVDTTMIAPAKTRVLDQPVELSGQRFTLKQLEIYPTHITLHLEEDADNTAWLDQLQFCFETEDGKQFSAGSSGLISQGEDNTDSALTYYAESPYFYEADSIKLVVFGAKLRDKSVWIPLDLETGESETTFPGYSFAGRKIEGNQSVVSFLVETDSIFGDHAWPISFYDKAGRSLNTNLDSMYHEDQTHVETYYLDTTDRIVYMKPIFTDRWQPETPLVYTIH